MSGLPKRICKRPGCGKEVKGRADKLYCSEKCKCWMWNRRLWLDRRRGRNSPRICKAENCANPVDGRLDKLYCSPRCRLKSGNRAYRKRNPDKIRAACKKYQQQHPERCHQKSREWAAKNPGKVRETKQRGTAKRRHAQSAAQLRSLITKLKEKPE